LYQVTGDQGQSTLAATRVASDNAIAGKPRSYRQDRARVSYDEKSVDFLRPGWEGGDFVA